MVLKLNATDIGNKIIKQQPGDVSDKKWPSLKAVVQEAKLTATNGMNWSYFGRSVSISGDRALIGAWGDSNDSGSAYVFEFSDGNWTQTAKLTAGDGAAFDNFGVSVSLLGDQALIGAYADDDNGNSSGSAYIFEFSGGSWTQIAKLIAEDGGSGDYFGNYVSLSVDRALIGAHGDEDNGRDSGSAYIFDYSIGSWSQTAKLVAEDADADDYFGESVSLSGDRVLIGANGDDNINGSDSGSAYIFDYDNISWSQTEKLIAGDAGASGRFGFAVSLSGDRALIGEYGDAYNGTNTGSAYIFDYINSSWSQTGKLIAGDGAAHDRFGFAVSLSGNRALIGSTSDNSNTGSAYFFESSGGSWSQTDKLTANDGTTSAFFGGSVSLSSDDRLLIGAYGDDSNTGSAYIFEIDLIFSNGFDGN